MTKSSVDVYDLLRNIRLAWVSGVSADYINGLVWAGEFAATASFFYHLRRMYLDYHPSLRMWFEVSVPDVGRLDITISEVLPNFKGHKYDSASDIEKRDLFAIELKYATGYEGSDNRPGVKKDIEKLEGLLRKQEFKSIVPLIAYIDYDGSTKKESPCLETIRSRIEDGPIGLLYGHPSKSEGWESYNLPNSKEH